MNFLKLFLNYRLFNVWMFCQYVCMYFHHVSAWFPGRSEVVQETRIKDALNYYI